MRIRMKKGKLDKKRAAEVTNRGIPQTELKPKFPKVLDFVTYYRHLVHIQCKVDDLPLSIDSGYKEKRKFEFFVNINGVNPSNDKYLCYSESNNLILNIESLKLNNSSTVREFREINLLIVGRLSKKVLFTVTCNFKTVLIIQISYRSRKECKLLKISPKKMILYFLQQTVKT